MLGEEVKMIRPVPNCKRAAEKGSEGKSFPSIYFKVPISAGSGDLQPTLGEEACAPLWFETSVLPSPPDGNATKFQ